MGAALFAEYESVVGRAELFRGCPLNGRERSELLNAFLNICKWVQVFYLWRPNLRDEADNHLVELAAAGGASTIVTNNVRDFEGEQMAFLKIRAMTPGMFLSEVDIDR